MKNDQSVIFSDATTNRDPQLLIGAIGALFEQDYYFRHGTYVDEET